MLKADLAASILTQSTNIPFEYFGLQRLDDTLSHLSHLLTEEAIFPSVAV